MPSSQGTSCSLIPREPDFRINFDVTETELTIGQTTDDEEKSHKTLEKVEITPMLMVTSYRRPC